MKNTSLYERGAVIHWKKNWLACRLFLVFIQFIIFSLKISIKIDVANDRRYQFMQKYSWSWHVKKREVIMEIFICPQTRFAVTQKPDSELQMRSCGEHVYLTLA